ncbi:MAG TPA: hypothetical protein VHU83_09005 [Bryobacteraceae bacterium]|jgi:hypothetical protein|nr:hypothetical protein [Bryobacteraceae bacterium]
MAKKQRPEHVPSAEAEAAAKPKVIPQRRTENFTARYVNNFKFENTVFDLKILFGQTALIGDEEISEQHTALTLPWSAIKLLVYRLQANLILHEAINGQVIVPPTQMPPVPPGDVQGREEILKLRATFVENQ